MAAREFSLTFETTPPAAARPALPFTIPVVVAVRPVGAPQNAQHLVVNASLRNEAGTGPAVGLSGCLTASVTSRASGYAKFPTLSISVPGKYRLRVMLSAASVNGVVTKEFVDSGVIHVHTAAPIAQRPSGSSFLPPLIICPCPSPDAMVPNFL